MCISYIRTLWQVYRDMNKSQALILVFISLFAAFKKDVLFQYMPGAHSG